MTFDERFQKVVSKGYSDKEIWALETWYEIEEDDDPSTEYLIQLTCDITGIGFDHLMDLLQRFSDDMAALK